MHIDKKKYVCTQTCLGMYIHTSVFCSKLNFKMFFVAVFPHSVRGSV